MPEFTKEEARFIAESRILVLDGGKTPDDTVIIKYMRMMQSEWSSEAHKTCPVGNSPLAKMWICLNALTTTMLNEHGIDVKDIGKLACSGRGGYAMKSACKLPGVAEHMSDDAAVQAARIEISQFYKRMAASGIKGENMPGFGGAPKAN